MVYAYDQNMQMPVKDLYDTQMMAMAINAAKDMYEKGLEQMDEFNKLYGDFYTPIGKDMAAYNSLVIDPYKDAIDRLYANGIDPIRSAEGRAVLARIKNSVPTGKVNALKQSAETAKLYQKALGEAIASGKYDPDVDRFFNPVGLDEWDTLGSNKIPGMGVWNRPAPTTIKTIKEATSDWFKNRSAHDLTPEQMKREGYAFDPRYNYTGWLYDDLLKTTGDMTPGWQSSLEAKYYRAQAKKQLENAGVKNITPDMVEAQLRYNIAEANREWIMDPTKKANEYVLDDHRTANDIKAAAEKAKIDDRYDAIKYFRENPDKDPNNYDKNGNYINPITGTVVSQKQLTIDPEDHNSITAATGVANLFTPGGGGTVDDFSKNWEAWSDDMRNVENKIARELAIEKEEITDNGKKMVVYHGLQPHKWVQRHLTNYDPALMPEFFRQPTVADVNGEQNGKTMYVGNDLTNRVYTENEVMAKNKNRGYAKYGKSHIPSKDTDLNSGKYIRQQITLSQNTEQSSNNKKRGALPLVTSTGKIFSQVENDNKVHHYFQVKLSTANGVSQKIVYIDTGLTSYEGNVVEDGSNWSRNRSQNMSATEPNSAGKKEAYKATHE